MGKANAKNTIVSYVAEVVPGTTPATPTFKRFRCTGESLDVTRKVGFSSELDGMRGEKNASLLMKNGSGALPFELSYATLDDLLESLMRNTWSTDVLVDANLQKTFTVETRFETGTTDIFKRLTGAEVESLDLSIRAGEIATGSVSFMALNAAYANAIVAGATYNAPNTNPVHNGADVGSITLTGVTVGCVPQIDISIKNNIEQLQCLGSLSPTDQTAGKLEVTGSLSIVLTDDEYDVLTAASELTQLSLSFNIGKSAGSKYQFEFPAILLENTKVAAESAESGTVLINTPFRALQASSLSNSVIRVTRAI
jgi:hypothetical protein